MEWENRRKVGKDGWMKVPIRKRWMCSIFPRLVLYSVDLQNYNSHPYAPTPPHPKSLGMYWQGGTYNRREAIIYQKKRRYTKRTLSDMHLSKLSMKPQPLSQYTKYFYSGNA